MAAMAIFGGYDRSCLLHYVANSCMSSDATSTEWTQLSMLKISLTTRLTQAHQHRFISKRVLVETLVVFLV